MIHFFFFQAEDGIRDFHVTGVQTCALPIWLEGELAELTGQLRDLEEATGASMSEAIGEVGFDEEYADAGTYTFERERDLSLVDNVKDLIEKVQHALTSIDDGSYGRCEVCGKPIEAERLDALPYTTLCLVDARHRMRPR